VANDVAAAWRRFLVASMGANLFLDERNDRDARWMAPIEDSFAYRNISRCCSRQRRSSDGTACAVASVTEAIVGAQQVSAYR